MRPLWILLLLWPASALAIDDFSLAKRMSLTAETEARWAVGTGQGKSQTAELTIKPEAEIELTEGVALNVSGRLRADAFDELNPGHPTQHEVSTLSRRSELGDQVDVDLREFFVETEIGPAYALLGKQHIVWGKSDGLKVLDVVNPQDFREFILDDFEDSRITLWAANVEIPIKDAMLQLVWLPDPTYHEIPETGATYAFTSRRIAPAPPAGVSVTQLAPDRPKRLFNDSDAGFRLSGFWKGWDLTFNYLYHYDDRPIGFRTISVTPVVVAPGVVVGVPMITVAPSYERTHLVGGTFSNAFGDLTVRGEAGYFTDRFFPVGNPLDADGVKETGELRYVLGFDWYGFSETLFSLQVFQSWMQHHTSGMFRDEWDTTVSVLARREFMNDRLLIESIWIHNYNDGDGLIRPKIEYELSDTLKLRCGLDFFYGTPNGLFGEFKRNDRVFVSVEWTI